MEGTESVCREAKLFQQLLEGSKRINEMRKEIDAVIGMTLGLLSVNDLQLDPSLSSNFLPLAQFIRAGIHWEIRKHKKKLSVLISSERLLADNLPDIWHYPPKDLPIPLKFVQSIHQGLPQFMVDMVALFPQLNERFAPLLEVAKM